MKKVSREQFIQFITKYHGKISQTLYESPADRTSRIVYTGVWEATPIAEEKSNMYAITSMDESNDFYIKET